jgi:hypothetical protein
MWQCYLSMFLKKNRRNKNGREFTYYNIVENRRCHGGKVVQRQVLYLGELNSSQLGEWRKTIEVFDEDASTTSQLALFEQDRLPELADDTHVEIRLCDLQLRRPRQWGACWIALHHWDLLRLDAVVSRNSITPGSSDNQFVRGELGAPIRFALRV